MVIFQRSSLASSQETSCDNIQQVPHRQPHRSSIISSHSSGTPISASFRFSMSGRYSSTAFDPGMMNDNNAAQPSRFHELCFCYSTCCRRPACMAINSPIVMFCKRVIRSRIWKLLMMFFYSFVLFGSQIHHIWALTDDQTYNILAIITFGFCLVELALRILVEPNYFQFGVAGCHSNNRSGYNLGNDNNSSCAVGSFMFWCDLVSMGVILLDVGWVNSGVDEQRTIEIELDAHGFPVRICFD